MGVTQPSSAFTETSRQRQRRMGTRVKIHGLTSDKSRSLNGQTGFLMGQSRQENRDIDGTYLWYVRVNGETKVLRWRNLQRCRRRRLITSDDSLSPLMRKLLHEF